MSFINDLFESKLRDTMHNISKSIVNIEPKYTTLADIEELEIELKKFSELVVRINTKFKEEKNYLSVIAKYLDYSLRALELLDLTIDSNSKKTNFLEFLNRVEKAVVVFKRKKISMESAQGYMNELMSRESELAKKFNNSEKMVRDMSKSVEQQKFKTEFVLSKEKNIKNSIKNIDFSIELIQKEIEDINNMKNRSLSMDMNIRKLLLAHEENGLIKEAIDKVKKSSTTDILDNFDYRLTTIIKKYR